EHGEHHRFRTPEVDESVHRRADRAAGVEHVVDQNDDLVIDRLGKLRRFDHRLRRDGGQIIAIQRDVQDAEGNRMSLHRLDLFGDALADGDAATADADDNQIAQSAIFFHDLDGHPADCASHPRAIEQPFLHIHSRAEAPRTEPRENNMTDRWRVAGRRSEKCYSVHRTRNTHRRRRIWWILINNSTERLFFCDLTHIISVDSISL